jgi:murein L,D-transpeptidase YcbB/YkuD
MRKILFGALIAGLAAQAAWAQSVPTPTPRPAAPRGPVLSASPLPTFDEGTFQRIGETLLSYSAIDVRGGWPTLPENADLALGSRGPDVALLRSRLVVTEDLAAEDFNGDVYDEKVAVGVRRFQARHGLADTGRVDRKTLAELNVPVKRRLRQLAASLDRLGGENFLFGQRYVVVNIPAAVAEAVAGGRVERRHIVVVGKPDRASPTVTATIRAVNLNPTWTVPLSILKKDIVTRMRRDPGYIRRMHMRVLGANGGETDPTLIDWKSTRSPNFTVRQDSGNFNALGNVRIDMPNPHAVYMHDTNHRNLFHSDYRFHSSGCARVADVRALAAWLLRENPGWGRGDIDAAIAKGARTNINLTHGVPVAWVYLTGWVTRDGAVHFREDVYNRDDDPPRSLHIAVERAPLVTAARASGFVLQSGQSATEAFVQNSYLDSR